MNKDLARYIQEICRKAYLQGASDASNGYIADNDHDIDMIIEQIGMEIIERERDDLKRRNYQEKALRKMKKDLSGKKSVIIEYELP